MKSKLFGSFKPYIYICYQSTKSFYLLLFSLSSFCDVLVFSPCCIICSLLINLLNNSSILGSSEIGITYWSTKSFWKFLLLLPPRVFCLFVFNPLSLLKLRLLVRCLFFTCSFLIFHISHKFLSLKFLKMCVRDYRI